MKLFAILLVGLLCFPAGTKASEVFQVILDPGHGGHDAGATRGHIKEADIALSVSHRIRQELDGKNGIRIALTRDTNQAISLMQRSEMAKRLRGDLFISIHANSNLDTRVHGAEFYFKSQLPPEEESLFLASRENSVDPETILDSEPKNRPAGLAAIKEDLETTYHLYMSRELGRALKTKWMEDHGVKSAKVRQGPFHVISHVPMPSLLVELGFISNPQESRWLASTETQSKLAISIAKGIVLIKEQMDKNTKARHIATHAN